MEIKIPLCQVQLKETHDGSLYRGERNKNKKNQAVDHHQLKKMFNKACKETMHKRGIGGSSWRVKI